MGKTLATRLDRSLREMLEHLDKAEDTGDRLQLAQSVLHMTNSLNCVTVMEASAKENA